MSHAVRWVAGLLALAASAGAATAEPVSEEARRRAEDAFVAARYDDLESSLGTGTTPADFEPIAVRDAFWRRRSPSLAERPADDGSLSSRRIAWLADPTRWGGDYPLPRAGETDPYPRLTALVLDRIRRETVGARGLPEESPLAAVRDENLAYVQSAFGRRAFRGPAADELTEEERVARVAALARGERVVRRNRSLAVASVLLLCAATAGAAWRLSRRRKPGSAATEA